MEEEDDDDEDDDDEDNDDYCSFKEINLRRKRLNYCKINILEDDRDK